MVMLDRVAGRGSGPGPRPERARSAEADFLARLRLIATDPGARGLLDDVATLVPPPGETLVLTHDLLVEGVHYLPEDPPEDVAWKLVAVNLSDLAAKGARPLGALLGYMLGEPDWDARFVEGLAAVLARFEVPLLGGDTVAGTAGTPRTLGLTAIGSAARVPDRRGARAGDGLWVTGTIGDAGLGLRIARAENSASPLEVLYRLRGRGLGEGLPASSSASPGRKVEEDPHPDPLPRKRERELEVLLSAYRRPVPRLDLGPQVAALARATADVSDGLLIDAARIADASGLAVAIDLAAIPLSGAARRIGGADRAARLAAATAGDDYQILAAAPTDAGAALAELGLVRVGRFAAGGGLSLTDDGVPIAVPARLGWEHAAVPPGT